LPFEALQIAEGVGADPAEDAAAKAPAAPAGPTEPLISKMRVRYAPTLGLAMPDGRVLPASPASAIVAGRMYPKEDPAIAKEAAAEIVAKLPGAYVTPEELAGPGSLYAASIDRLIVLDDVDDLERGVFEWAPMRSDKGKPPAFVSAWALFPWRGPQQVILPGFHTPAEHGLKRGGSGEELFLQVMGLMASGSRTVVLSRWRTAGQSSYDLTTELVQQLPNTSAADAWQRSVQLAMTMPLDLAREPRVRPAGDERLTAEHPFFWAGYLLIDSGQEPRE
jgi:hypothetical protein